MELQIKELLKELARAEAVTNFEIAISKSGDLLITEGE